MPASVETISTLQAIYVELRDGIELRRSDATARWTLMVDGHRLDFRLPSGSAADLCVALQNGGCPLADLVALPEERGRTVTARTELEKLWTRGWLAQVVTHGSTRMAVLHNYGDLPVFPSLPSHAAHVMLTEDALIRRVNGRLAIESVACGAMVTCLDPRLFALPGLLLAATSITALASALALPTDVVASVIAWLLALGAVTPIDANVSAAIGWSFSDRLMHARSRRGRHTGGYGGTFPLRGVMPEPPAIRPSSSERSIALWRPDLTEIARREDSFTSVLERRRSIREHSDTPLSMRLLSEFLYRVARVTTVTHGEPYSIARRPYPAGGGLHELELYPLINRCDGLAPALYRYNGAAHALEQVSAPTGDTRRLLAEAKATCLMRGEPHVLLLIAARFARVQWKYESIAYALTLKNVGVLIQTLYLVATAMGLAPCCLGGGNADGFSRATQLGYWEESLVGEFMLGRPANARVEQTTT